MSVLINGMKIPKSCFDCPLYDDEESSCKAQNEFLNLIISNRDRAISCPLIELPEHHGRLIDADEMRNLWAGCSINGFILPLLDARPTIVEAE